MKSATDEQTYVGLASTTFKLRLGNHKLSINNETYRGKTTLSRYIWDLKDSGANYDIEWTIIGRAQPFNPTSGICNLCTLEKYHIMFTPERATINKREELNNF